MIGKLIYVNLVVGNGKRSSNKKGEESWRLGYHSVSVRPVALRLLFS